MRKIAAVLCLSASLATAQQSKPATPPPPPPQPTIAPLSDLERTKLENLQLKYQLANTVAQAQAGNLEAERQALVASIESAHPGYRWQQGQGPNQPSGLVPVTPTTKK